MFHTKVQKKVRTRIWHSVTLFKKIRAL